jgi:hypothetical protein
MRGYGISGVGHDYWRNRAEDVYFGADSQFSPEFHVQKNWEQEPNRIDRQGKAINLAFSLRQKDNTPM